MARPRIFVSSTYYDLKHIRSSLEIFIESLGYDPILFERGDVAFLPDDALDESCYREVAAADIYVMVIGGRYGSEISSGDGKPTKAFFDRYDSITKKEFMSAYESDVPIFILIDNSVYSEYRTYLKNRDNKEIRYAHVDSVNIFILLEDILSRKRNNPIFGFERSRDIEAWLREQWSGLFRELLKSRSQQKQLKALTDQILELKSTNETLRNYLETVIRTVNPTDSSRIIESEHKRESDSKRLEGVKANHWFKYMTHEFPEVSHDDIVEIITGAKSFSDFRNTIYKSDKFGRDRSESVIQTLRSAGEAQKDFNDIRTILGRSRLSFSRVKEIE